MINDDKMDVACFLYDTSKSDSFSKIAQLHQVMFSPFFLQYSLSL